MIGTYLNSFDFMVKENTFIQNMASGMLFFGWVDGDSYVLHDAPCFASILPLIFVRGFFLIFMDFVSHDFVIIIENLLFHQFLSFLLH